MKYTHRYISRVVIEFVTPFIVASGKEGVIADSVFVTDANGLPTIPGSSLAGVLRSAYEKTYGKQETEKIFGFQGRAGNGSHGSELSVSWACIHDSKNKPVEGLFETDTYDEVLTNALAPVIRDHVKINHLGAADSTGHGKFDEQPVSAGHRFTFELEYTGDASSLDLWKKLKKVLLSSGLRIGGKSRRGFGAFKIVSLKEGVFELRKEYLEYAGHPVALSAECSLKESVVNSSSNKPDNSFGKITLKLKPCGYWMFGGGEDLPGDRGNADAAPVRDSRVTWENNSGKITEGMLIIPGTSLKGAIAHRTAFHYNALSGIFVDKPETGKNLSEGQNNPAVSAIFGYVDGTSCSRGKVLIDDVYYNQAVNSQLVHHVSIDRFTGGARDQMLFNERPLWQGEEIEVNVFIENDKALKTDELKALKMALDDLVEARLQVGAGSGRGEGYFAGLIEYDDTAKNILGEAVK